MARGDDPRRLLAGVLPPGSVVPQDIDRMTLWKVGGGEPRGPWTVLKGIITFMRYSVQVLFNLLSEPERREKLHNVNTLEDVVSTSNGATAIPILPMSQYPCFPGTANPVLFPCPGLDWSRSLGLLWHPGLQEQGWRLRQVGTLFS